MGLTNRPPASLHHRLVTSLLFLLLKNAVQLPQEMRAGTAQEESWWSLPTMIASRRSISLRNSGAHIAKAPGGRLHSQVKYWCRNLWNLQTTNVIPDIWK